MKVENQRWHEYKKGWKGKDNTRENYSINNNNDNIRKCGEKKQQWTKEEKVLYDESKEKREKTEIIISK